MTPENAASTAADTVLAQLMSVIQDRKRNPSEKSYTASLFQGGLTKIGSKILEEAHEVVEAAAEPGDTGRAHLIYESADLIYHLMVMLGYHDIPISDVEQEIARRFGMSGINEKNSRPKK